MNAAADRKSYAEDYAAGYAAAIEDAARRVSEMCLRDGMLNEVQDGVAISIRALLAKKANDLAQIPPLDTVLDARKELLALKVRAPFLDALMADYKSGYERATQESARFREALGVIEEMATGTCVGLIARTALRG